MAYLIRMTITGRGTDGEEDFCNDYPSHRLCDRAARFICQAERVLFDLHSAEGWSLTMTSPDGEIYEFQVDGVCPACNNDIDEGCKPD